MNIQNILSKKLLPILILVLATQTLFSQKIVRYDLYVRDTIVNYSGKEKRAIAVNGQIPMPTLTFTEGDIAEILGLELFEDAYGEKHISKEQNIYINKIHKEMETVLQILVCNLSIQVGQYECQKYCSKWNLIKG